MFQLSWMLYLSLTQRNKETHIPAHTHTRARATGRFKQTTSEQMSGV